MKKHIKKVATGIVGAIIVAIGSIVPILPPEGLTVNESMELVQIYNEMIQEFGRLEWDVENGRVFESLNDKLIRDGADYETELLLLKANKSMHNSSLIDKII